MPTDSGVLANRVLDELEVMVFNGNFNSLEKLVNYVDSSYRLYL